MTDRGKEEGRPWLVGREKEEEEEEVEMACPPGHWQKGWVLNRHSDLKTAKALGLTVPPTLFARADEVIE